MIGIYKITCATNDKFYIGSSKNIEKRLITHKNNLSSNNHANKHLQNAWNLYGPDSFFTEVLEECNLDILINMEQKWLDKTVCHDRNIGFNILSIAGSPLGYRHTDECKELMSVIKKGQIKQGIAKPPTYDNTGNKHTSETIHKQRECKLGNKNPNFGKKEDPSNTKIRMKNMLSKPRWNAGLTIKDDPRIAKLGDCHIGVTPSNAVPHKLMDNDTGEEWSDKSLSHLSIICPVSISSLGRLKLGKAGKNFTKKYKLTW
jgi:group I intron endonuclease